MKPPNTKETQAGELAGTNNKPSAAAAREAGLRNNANW
eukprot:CAMPEP_0178443430 /NCGR_PEP_ID=MMETSP0689_2-20121128/38895_1 /TAXON_ID=160604 /ORGANISM="Amphidinium massartii, Strain CS-259" /LENGTH=37 /DNA_ID= /DNA_START= /DNA_END= /DNA_ORIENTATION=